MKSPLARIEDIKAPGRHSLVGGPFGSNLTSRDYKDEGVPVIRGANLPDDERFVQGEFVWVSEEKADQLTQNNAYPGDIVFTQRGTLGQVGLVAEDSPYRRYLLSQSQMKLTVNRDMALPEYVYYVFSSSRYKDQIKSRSITSGVPHINLGILQRISIPLPSIKKQRDIVDTVSTYDDLIENNRRRIQLLEESARLLYREWFVHLRFPGHEHVKVTDGVPEGWQRVPVRQLGKVVTGKTPSKKNSEYYGGKVPFIKIPDMHGNSVIVDTEDTLSEQGAASQANKSLPPNSILVSCIGTVGLTAVNVYSAHTNQQINSVIPNSVTHTHYCLFALSDLRPKLESMGGGATMANVSKGKLEGMEILLPPNRLLRSFSEFAEPVFQQIKTLALQNQKLAQARDLLLPRLMNGEIAV